MGEYRPLSHSDYTDPSSPSGDNPPETAGLQSGERESSQVIGGSPPQHPQAAAQDAKTFPAPIAELPEDDPLAFLKTPPTNSPSEAGRPSYRLHSALSVGWASALGSITAGGTILAINYWRLRRRWAAIGVFVSSVAAAIGLGMMLGVIAEAAESEPPPVTGAEGSVRGWMIVVVALCMGTFAELLQGKAIRTHQRSGGKMASGWVAFGIGAGWAVLWVVLFVTVYRIAAGQGP